MSGYLQLHSENFILKRRNKIDLHVETTLVIILTLLTLGVISIVKKATQSVLRDFLLEDQEPFLIPALSKKSHSS